MNVEKLKDKARKLEQRDDPSKAIEVYMQIVRELEGTPELDDELPLYNKVGDLYIKAGNVTAAVEMYERAVNRYTESGFPNNAIALCNKILRSSPGRTQIYLKLAQLMVQRGFLAEAKQNFIEYAERMQKAGKLEEAFRALKEFADLSPDNEEIRLMLAEQLKAAARTDEAREQLAKLYAEVEAKGDARRSRETLSKLRAIDPEYDVERAPRPSVGARPKKSTDIVFLDLDEGVKETEEPEPAGQPTGFESTVVGETEDVEEADLVVERASEETRPTDLPSQAVEGLDLGTEFEAPTEVGGSLDVEPTSLNESLETPAAAPSESADVDDEEPIGGDLPLLEVEPDGAAEPSEPSTVPAAGAGDVGTESAEEDDELKSFGDDLPELQIGGEGDEVDILAEFEGSGIEVPELDLDEVDDAGEEVEVAEEKEPAAAAPDGADSGAFTTLDLGELDVDGDDVSVDVPAAVGGTGRTSVQQTPTADPVAELETPDLATLEALVADDPDDPDRHKDLAEALLEAGQRERGLEEVDIALAASESKGKWDQAESLAADEKPSAPAADFVDLGALVMDESRPTGDTRLRIEDEEPTGDEQRDFEEMLAQFKKGIEANLADEDAEAHYDLGVAFKEMGLLDEAISEFQKALRGPDGRLRASEALGMCFFEKGQFSVAATVLRRAIESDHAGDDKKIGLLYWLGRCEQEQGRGAEALTAYQRVFALDIQFQDVSERVKGLAKVNG